MMDNEEGYIKFNADWIQGGSIAEDFLQDIIRVRQELYDLQWIGVYPDGVGYGNISKRWEEKGQFVISGTATGHLETLNPAHFSLVTGVNISENKINCTGPLMASSESMSHAAIYRQCPDVQGVIHIHDPVRWRKWLHKAPTPPESVPYGTPEMAYAIMQLLEDPVQAQWKFLVMAGHEEGCITFGKDLQQAFEILTNLSKNN